MVCAVVCAMIPTCNSTCVSWLFQSRVNIDFHGKFWHYTCKKFRGVTCNIVTLIRVAIYSSIMCTKRGAIIRVEHVVTNWRVIGFPVG